MRNTNPKISVVIPTTGDRPELLRRAINSALSGFLDGDVEILLVPNGDKSFERVNRHEFTSNHNVSVHPMDRSNVSAARNLGLSLAKGQAIRFLDDDDFLIPEIAVKQVHELLDSDSHISSYAVRSEDERGFIYQTITQPKTADFVSGQLSCKRNQLPLAHLFKANSIKNCSWPEGFCISEDIVWLHTVAQAGEHSWITSDEVVGVWFQHSAPRLSFPRLAHKPNQVAAESILATLAVLKQQGRLNPVRQAAGLTGLWRCIHRAFFLKPFYWHKIANKAHAIDASSFPEFSIDLSNLFRWISPVTFEWILVPFRLISFGYLQIKGRLFGWNHVRHL